VTWRGKIVRKDGLSTRASATVRSTGDRSDQMCRSHSSEGILEAQAQRMADQSRAMIGSTYFMWFVRN
jgi:hypothetical protein